MGVVSRGWDLSARRAVALFLGLVAIVLLAGAGGYLIKGATTLVVTPTITGTVVTPTQLPLGPSRTHERPVPRVGAMC